MIAEFYNDFQRVTQTKADARTYICISFVVALRTFPPSSFSCLPYQDAKLIH